jgi:uncharacterized protein YndB with AHSA1/START domain
MIRHQVSVTSDSDEAFRQFAEQLDRWWPREYTWSGDVLQAIGIEPREGGLCYEPGPHGFRCDWGRVLVWEPPVRLVLAWQISPRREPVPDPRRASEVEVQFDPDGRGGTRVTLEHRGFDRHGTGASEYRAAMASPQGWAYILARYTAA